MNEITTTNGYPIIDKVEIANDPGFFRILVQRPEGRCSLLVQKRGLLDH